MQVISDIITNKEAIEKSLDRYGCSAEHNYYYYLYNIEPWQNPYVFMFDDCCILSKHDTHEKAWYFVVEPVAPQDKKAELLERAIDYAFTKNIKKVWLELEASTRKDILRLMKNIPEKKVNKINYTLIWPVFDMAVWNGDRMEGRDWKDLRYYWNKFFRDNKVEFVSAEHADKDQMKRLVHEWKKKRTTGDKAFIEYYLNAIDKNFKGYDLNRVMLVNGNVAAITAGFKNREGHYYSSIGLYDKGIYRCNEIANMDDLISCKKLGYKYVDFGGQEKKSLDFKKKFRPTYYYKTHVFSIVKR